MPPPELTLKARYVFPVQSAPIEAGCVRVAGERIRHVGPTDRAADFEFPDAAIVPGFVNAHTHLELSSLRAKDLAGGSLVDWLRRVIDSRQQQTAGGVAHAIGRGIDASLSAGTTLLGDISTAGRSWRELIRSPLRATVFCEVLGLHPTRAQETTRAARQFLEWAGCSAEASVTVLHEDSSAESDDRVPISDFELDALPVAAGDWSARRLVPGLAPHAPYSSDVRLYELAAAWGRRSQLPVCTHLAESREELRLISHGAGPLRDFLAAMGAWPEHWITPGTNAIDYVVGADAPAWLLAHGNYLTEAEIARLAASCTRPGHYSIAFCPRTHFYFGHAPHPYPAMCAAGLNVCLGTDSLASTPTLSVLDEMRFLHRRDPQLPAAQVLNMATLAGARALGRETNCGSLVPDKFADLAIVRLPDRDDRDPHTLLLDSDEPVLRVMIGGRTVYQLRKAR